MNTVTYCCILPRATILRISNVDRHVHGVSTALRESPLVERRDGRTSLGACHAWREMLHGHAQIFRVLVLECKPINLHVSQLSSACACI